MNKCIIGNFTRDLSQSITITTRSFTLILLTLLLPLSTVRSSENDIEIDTIPPNSLVIKPLQYSVDFEELREKSDEDGSVNYDLFASQIKQLANSIKANSQLLTFWSSDLFFKANSAAAEGDSLIASLIYKQLVELNPNDLFLKKKYAIELIKINNIKDAKEQLELIVKETKYKDSEPALLLAGILTNTKDNLRAQNIYQRILQQNPGNQDACILLSRSIISNGLLERSESDNNNVNIRNRDRYQQAETVLIRCENKYTKEQKGIIRYQRGKLALEHKKWNKAKNLFLSSLELNPEHHFSILGLGGLYEFLGQVDDSISLYQKYLKKYPTQQTILNKIVQLLITQNRYDELIPYLTTLSRMDPEDLNLQIKLGVLYTDTERYSEAKKIFNSLLNVVPNSDKLLYYLGLIYLETKEPKKAIEYLSKVSSEGALFQDAQIQIAQAMLSMIIDEKISKQNNNHPLLQDFFTFVDKPKTTGRDVASIPSNSKKFLNNLQIIKAKLYAHWNDIETAIQIVNSLGIKNGEPLEQAYYLAELYEKNKNYHESYRIIREILNNDDKNAHAWNFLGYSMLERGENLAEAYNYIKKAIILKPNDAHIRDSLGWYYYKVGKYKLALNELIFSSQKIKNDEVICKHLAMVYHALRRYDLAKKYYLMLLELTEKDEEKEAISKILEKINKEQGNHSSHFANSNLAK
ncbi:MAG: tetratricopeptide repeat protein [Oligoflexia bacterium]|nr:tetratricopeptide repeat protein [Oligoflexia bacterium]